MKFKKSISFVLTLCMVLSLFATFVIPASAEPTNLVAGSSNYTTSQLFRQDESYAWNPESPITYPDEDGKSLTDGVKEAANFWDAAWVGFSARCPEYQEIEHSYVTFDLGAVCEISSIVLYTFADSASGIAAPYWVNYCVSEDGENWSEIGYVDNGAGDLVVTFEKEASARFVKVKIYEHGWCFLSEVEIYGTAPVEEEPATSNVVTDWNVADWNGTELGASAAIIFTDAEAYLATTGYTWWSHASFKPTDEAGVYEVVARRGATGEAVSYEIAEGGFVWLAHDTAAEGTPGAYAHAIIRTLNAGDKVVFTGLDIANQTTAADATAEKIVVTEDPIETPEFAGENVALNKKYTYPTTGLYFHWSDAWSCTDNVATAITDGVREAGYYGEGTTSGWGGASPNPLEVVIDLEAVYNINGFVYVLCGGADGISHPEVVEISVSTDNETFVPVSVETVTGNKYFSQDWSPCYDLDYYATPASAVEGRYVKFAFTKTGNFVFINELEVYGTEAVEDDDVLTWEDGWVNDPADTNPNDGQNLKFDNAYGYTFVLDADKKINGEDNIIITNVDEYKACNPNWAVSVLLKPAGDLYEVVIVVPTPGSAATGIEKGIAIEDGNIVLVAHSSASHDAYPNWQAKLCALALKAGDLIRVSETEAYVLIPGVDEVPEAPVEEDDESYKETHTHVDGETVGTTQSRGDGWEALLVPDFWYVVEDGEATVTIKIAVDDRTVVEEDTMFRTWIDADLSDTARTTLVDVKVKDGVAYVARCDGGYDAAVLSATYEVIGNDYFFVVELDKATLGIDGQYGLMLTLSETGYNSMHNVAWDVYDVAGCAPWSTTAFYEIFGEEPEVPVAPEYNEGWNAEFDENELKLFKDVALFGDGKWGTDADAFGHADVILVQNLVCKNPDLYPELTLVYNAGTAIDVNNIKVGLYAETNSMIGFPSKDAKVYVSTDGIEWTLVDSTTDIPESVFVQHGNPENSLGTYVANIEFATSTAQYVKVVFTYTDSPFNDPNGDYKPVYEFIGFTEAEVSYVEPSAELPEDATGLDVYGYTHTFLNYVMYVDTDMTLGELTAKYYGSSKDLNYFKVIVVNADGTVAATYLELDRNTNPASVKTDIAVTAGQYVLALSANEANVGRHEIADTVNVGDIVTLYNVDFTAAPGALTNAGFTVEAAVSEDLNEVDGGDLPAHNPRLGSLNIAANTAITYTVAFEHGANFNLWSEDVTVLVNGEALEFGELGYVAVLAKGDTVTIVNAGAEAVEIYPSIAPVIPGTMSNPIILDELGDIVANVTEDIVMDSGAVFYTFTAPANGTLTITMPEGNWTYAVHNLTAGLYGDTQWSDSDPVLSTYSIEVSAGDEIQISVCTYDPEDMWNAPIGELTFNAAFEEAKVVSNVVTDWNTSKWGGANEAHIFTNQEAYLACTHTWWSHVSFKPTSFEGVYEVVAIRGANGNAAEYEIAEGGFIWLAHDTAAEGTAGAYAYALIKTLAVGDLVKFTGIDVANCTTTEDATAEKWEAPKADDVVKLEVSHQNLYNWGTYQSMIICDPGKTVVDVISQTPYWWIMYVVEEVDGVYVATAYYKNCDEINTTVCPENGFLYYVYSANSAWAVADEGKLLGYVFNVGDIVLGDKFAIDTSKDTPYTVVALNPEAIKAGDVNLNGEIDAADYAIVRKLVLGTLTAEDIGDLAYGAADVNGDGKVNARDYYLIKRAYLGTYVIPGWEVEDDAE